MDGDRTGESLGRAGDVTLRALMLKDETLRLLQPDSAVFDRPKPIGLSTISQICLLGGLPV